MTFLGKILELFSLFLIGIANLFYNYFLFFYESIYFYRSLALWKLRLFLFYYYMFPGPWILARLDKGKVKVPDEDLIYGETPFITVKKMLEWAGINKNDIFYDLGSGTGKVVLFVNIYFGINAVGIEILPSMVRLSKILKDKLKLKEVRFINGNFLEVDLRESSIVYVAGTAFCDSTIKQITEKFQELKKGTKIITLSYHIKAPYLRLIKEHRFYFSWGKSHVYLHERL